MRITQIDPVTTTNDLLLPYFRRAWALSKMSTELNKIGCLIVDRRAIVATGISTKYAHAEINALKQLPANEVPDEAAKYRMFLLGMSRGQIFEYEPCNDCLREIENYAVKNVYHT